MSYRILDSQSLQIDRVEVKSRQIVLHFGQASIEKIMDNADQHTMWTQAGMIEIQDPELSRDLPQTPFVILHSDVEDGVHVQRDMIRIPLDAPRGAVLSLWIKGQEGLLRLEGSRVSLHLEGNPRYIKHID